MKKKKIESNILLFIIIRSIFLLFFYKLSLLEIGISSIISVLIIFIVEKLEIQKSTLFKILMLLIIFISSIRILSESTSFIEYNILKNYSLITINITFLLICFILAYRGYHSYIKALELSFYLIIFLLISSLLLLISNIDISNFNMQLLNEINFSSKCIYFIISIVLSYLAINYLSNYKINYKTYSLTIISLIFSKLITIGILGETLLNLYHYPYISIFKRIKYLDFIERMEGILSFTSLFGFFFLLSGCLITLKFLLIDIFKLKKDKIINITLSIITILILLLSLIR